MTVDGIEQTDNAILLVDDRQEHVVEVRIPLREVYDFQNFMKMASNTFLKKFQPI